MYKLGGVAIRCELMKYAFVLYRCTVIAWFRAKLVYSIHGIGRPFSGSLVCAPFLEFYDRDEEGTERAALVPISDEPFVFFTPTARPIS
jgi:hypothetical protein